MRILIATLSMLFVACVVIVGIVNYSELVTVRLWPDSPEYTYPSTPVSWVIFFSALAGFVFAGIVAMLEGGKTRLSNARLRAQVRRMQTEIDDLKRRQGAVPDIGTDTLDFEPAEVEEEEPA
jgi:hypothetical protein